MRRLLGLALLVAGLGAAAPAAADEFDEGGTLYAIQKRQHQMGHEFSLGIGVLPMDAFSKGLTGTFQYTYHFSDAWAWEIVSFTYSANVDTSLHSDLVTNWKVTPVPFPEMNYFGDTNLVWTPLYGKLAYLNQKLIFGELYFNLGPAVAKYSMPGAYLGGDAGFGFRVHLSQYFSSKIDIRYYRFQQLTSHGSRGDDVLFLQLGLALNVR
jgi:outer membrane beta-barrel protein